MNEETSDLKESILTIQVNQTIPDDRNSGEIKSIQRSSDHLMENSVASPTNKNHNSDPIGENSLAF